MSKSPAPKIEYKRGRRANTDTAVRMIYDSKCGQYSVEKHISRYCNPTRTRWYAMKKQGGKFRMLVHMRTYRTRRAAERAIEKFSKSRPKV
jgi:hypothetical protein